MPQPTGCPLSAPGTTPHPPRATGAVVAAVFVGLWVVGATVAVQVTGWLVEQVLIIYGAPRPAWMWPMLSLLNAALVALPALLLLLAGRVPQPGPAHLAVAATGRLWLGGAAAVGLLGAVRAVPASESELQLALVAAAAAALAWWLARTEQGYAGQAAPGGALLGVACGVVVLLPWFWAGALGGALETLLAVIAAAAVGWLAASLVRRAGQGSLPVTGLAAGVALLLVAAGAGGSGAHLLLLVMLPPLGFTALALGRLRRRPPGGQPSLAGGRWPVAVLVGVAVLGPLALVDPEEVNLFQALARDVPIWAAVAAGGSALLALLLAIALRWLPALPNRLVAAVLLGASVVGATALYAVPGQPGWYGERLFVVLEDQANLSGLPAGTGQSGRDARASEVYRRLVAHAEASQADLRASLDRLRLPYTPYYLVNAVEVTGGPEQRAWLARRPEVARVLLSQQLRPLPVRSPMATGADLTPDDPEWNIALLGADRVWRELGVTGSGVVVGSPDSGVDGAHPALAAGFRGGSDSWHDPWNHTAYPTDHGGHGTHTLGSALGRGGIGVAPGAQWTACVNLDRPLGNPGLYLDCLQFMLAPYPPGGDPWRDGRPERAPHILTNSWGCPPIEGCDPGVLRPATAALAAAGIYVVVAAGNAGPFCGSVQDPPAPHPDVLTVGAVDRSGALAPFSSRGQLGRVDKPDLVAPGAGIRSAMPGGGYSRLDGTSMAAPHVAGVVALMWSASPALVADLPATTRILRQTAQPVQVEDPAACGGASTQVGAGLIDAYAAVSAALNGDQ